MTSPDDLLTLVRDYSSESPEFDLDAIVRAGHRRSRNRHVIDGAAATTTAAGIAVAVLVASQLQGSGADHHRAIAGGRPSHTASVKPPIRHTSPAPPAKAPAVKLVAYTGRQLAGYTVAEVPQGWFLGGVNQFTLTVNPPGDTNTDAAYFVDKLVVSLQPNSNLPAHGLQVSVNGHPGVIDGLGSALYGPTMAFEDGTGHTVDIEVPLILGWTTPGPLVSFAEGIQVTGDALPSVG